MSNYFNKMAFTGEIRMIKWGIIPTLPSFQISVGQKVGGHTDLLVKEIIREQITGTKREYHIVCVKNPSNKDENNSPFIWKTYHDEPDEVQYFLPDEKHNYIKL